MPNPEKELSSLSVTYPGAGRHGFSGAGCGLHSGCRRPGSELPEYPQGCLYLPELSPQSPCILCSQVAIKSIRKDKIKDEQDLMHIRREIEIMSSLNHPHIIAIHEGTEAGHLNLRACVRACVGAVRTDNTEK